MAFKKSYPLIWRTITDPVDGAEYKLALAIPTPEQMGKPAFYRADALAPIEFDGVIKGWDMELDHAFTQENLEAFLSHAPILGAYLRAKQALWEEAMAGKLVVGNSKALPSTGQEAAAPTQPTGGDPSSASSAGG